MTKLHTKDDTAAAGLYIPFAEAATLEAIGVLKPGKQTPQGLSAETTELFGLVVQAGEHGLARSHIPQRWLADPLLALTPLELTGWVAWEYDNRGTPTYLCLTWKGQEALSRARQQSQIAHHKPGAIRRKFSKE